MGYIARCSAKQQLAPGAVLLVRLCDYIAACNLLCENYTHEAWMGCAARSYNTQYMWQVLQHTGVCVCVSVCDCGSCILLDLACTTGLTASRRMAPLPVWLLTTFP